jgi:ribosomal protein S18 acetylase RimI-like enzyme
MSRLESVNVERVNDAGGRACVLEVLQGTYLQEKGWVEDVDSQFPADDLQRPEISWFVATIDDRPAGTLRVLYDPPLAEYAKYGFKTIDPQLRVEDFIRRHRIAEIGRFAVLPAYRRQMIVAAALMRAATAETIARRFTHYVTDVFEDDPHSPYRFHTNVLGFLPVATHDIGEMRTSSRRITLVLDLKAAYWRLKRQKSSWVYRYFTETWDSALHGYMTA